MKSLLIITVLTFFSVLVVGQCKIAYTDSDTSLSARTEFVKVKGWGTTYFAMVKEKTLNNPAPQFSIEISTFYSFATYMDRTRVLFRLSDNSVMEIIAESNTEKDYLKLEKSNNLDTLGLSTLNITPEEAERIYRFGIKKIRIINGFLRVDINLNPEKMLRFQRNVQCLYITDLSKENLNRFIYKEF